MPSPAATDVRAKFYAPGTDASTAGPVATILDVLDWQATLTQVNRFDGHMLSFAEVHREVLLAIPAFTTVGIEQVGLGVIARGVVTAPEQQVKENYQGVIVLTIPNLTDETLETSTGLGYVDAEPISQIVTNLGSLTTKGQSLLTGYDAQGRALTTVVPGRATGWSARFLDDGTLLDSAAPVTWGTLNNAAANGNSVNRLPGGVPGWSGAGGSGTPTHVDVTKNCSLQWQIVVPSICQAGLRPDATVGTPAWGFDFSGPTTTPDGTLHGVWTVIAGSALVGGVRGAYTGNTSFSVALVVTNGVPTMRYFVAGLLVYTSALTPLAPFVPSALIATPGGAVSNAIFARTVPTSQAWYQVQYNKLTQVGAVLQLAQDTGMFVRQGADASGVPTRSFEFGPMNAAATVRLIDGRGGTLDKLRANPNIRVIKEITSYKRDVSGVYTVATPLGGGQGSAQVTLELLWRILNDPQFADYAGKYQSLAAIFPEYDPNFTIHRTATLSVGYEYFMVYEPAFAPIGYAAWLAGGALAAGALGYKEGGPAANAQIVNPQQATLAQQEATARLLYKAWVELMKRAVVPHVTVTLTTYGDLRPPRAGDRVHLDYTQTATDRLGPWTPTRILTGTDPTNPDPRLLSATRAATGDAMPVDTYVLSNLGKYEDTVASQQAGLARQVAAIQVTTQTGVSVSFGNPAMDNIENGYPVTLPFYIPATVFRLTAAYLAVSFFPFRQPVTTSDNPAGTPVVTVGGVEILLPTPHDINALSAAIGGMPTHYHSVGVANQSFRLTIPSQQPNPQDIFPDRYLTIGGDGSIDGGGGMSLLSNGHSGTFRTGQNEDYKLNLAPSAHPHVVAKANDIIAHIPAGTVLADLPLHVHDIKPATSESSTPTGIAIEIDSGDGVFVERTAQLFDIRSNQPGTAAGFTGPFVVELSRFVSYPGRFVNVRLSSIGNADNGRGRVSWNTTVLAEVGGAGSIVNATQ